MVIPNLRITMTTKTEPVQPIHTLLYTTMHGHEQHARTRKMFNMHQRTKMICTDTNGRGQRMHRHERNMHKHERERAEHAQTQRSMQRHERIMHKHERIMHKHERIMHKHERIMHKHERSMHKHERSMHKHERSMHKHERERAEHAQTNKLYKTARHRLDQIRILQ